MRRICVGATDAVGVERAATAPEYAYQVRDDSDCASTHVRAACVEEKEARDADVAEVAV